MFTDELVQQEFYRLKNQITDLKNALDINRDILSIITSKSLSPEGKTDTLYKIINKLTRQSNQALLTNAELVLQKSQLALQINQLKQQLYHSQRKLQAELHRNSLLQNPTLSKLTVQQQFSSLNHELLASHEEKIHLQEEINRWKERYLILEEYAQRKQRDKHDTQETVEETKGQCKQDQLFQIPLKKSKISRKYTCNKTVSENQTIAKLQKEVVSLTRYIQELQNRIIFFIKAYNMQQDMLEQKQSGLLTAQTLATYQDLHVNLLKYAINQIRLEKREEELFMTIKHTFRQSEEPNLRRKDKRNHSFPKHKQSYINPYIKTNNFKRQNSQPQPAHYK